MSLKDQMAADLAPGGCFADTESLAETIAYYASATADPISLDVSPWSIDSKNQHDHGHADTDERLVAFTLPRAALATEPQRGASIHRETDADESARWDFDQILDSDSAGWVVRFVRATAHRVGKLRPSQL